jgi:peroxiredoxin
MLHPVVNLLTTGQGKKLIIFSFPESFTPLITIKFLFRPDYYLNNT